MPYKVSHCTQLMEQLAPLSYALEWDNSGLNIGNYSQSVTTVLVTLTITEAVVDRAIRESAELIIAHHPLIFRPIKKIRTDFSNGRIIEKVLSHKIAVYCSHTNLDRAPQGLNAWLAEEVGLRDHAVLDVDPNNNEVGLGRIGDITPQHLKDLVASLEQLWHTKLRYVGEPTHHCRKVAVCGGAGSDLIHLAAMKKADVLITGDVKYHDALEAQEQGLNVIDAGHFATERIMTTKVSEYFRTKLPELKVIESTDGDDPFCY